MAEERYTVKYPLPDNVIDFVANLRSRERSGEIESSQTNGYLVELSDLGWTLRAIANALNGVNIEAVRERIAKGRITPPKQSINGPDVPESPSRTKRNQVEIDRQERLVHQPYRIPDSVSDRMKLLQVDAREVRGSTPADSPKRIASIELTKLMHSEKEKGATFVEIGRASGVSWSAAKFRLARYGFYVLPPSMVHTAMEDLSKDPVTA